MFYITLVQNRAIAGFRASRGRLSTAIAGPGRRAADPAPPVRLRPGGVGRSGAATGTGP
jgi:hypothetical protein